MQRKVIAELLDDDLGTGEEIATSLADLRRINDWFGGTGTSIALLRRIARMSGHELSLLEVGAGEGWVPLAAQQALAREHVAVEVTLLDRIASHLPANGTASVAAGALHLPFRDDSFDVVSCCLFAHHFDPGDLQVFAREALRVSRRAVVINDLIRSPIHLMLVYLGLPLFRSRITRHDATASVRRAYTIGEMRELLSPLSKRIEITAHYLYRMGVLIWK